MVIIKDGRQCQLLIKILFKPKFKTEAKKGNLIAL